MHRVANLGWLGVMLLAFLLPDFAWTQNNTFTLQASFQGIDGAGIGAADPTGAAGPTKLVLATNHQMVILDKTGQAIASTIILDFFNARALGESAGDPRVIFDPWSHRFFIAAAGRLLDPTCTPGTCKAHLYLAVSRTTDPMTFSSSDWLFYAFDGTLDGITPTVFWSDFPGLGVDENVVVISSIANNQNGFTEYARIRILDKSKVLRGEPVSWTDFSHMQDPLNGDLAVNFQPALHFDRSGAFFLISPSMAISCGLIVWGIDNPLSSPVLSARTAVSDGQCNNPPSALQPGGGTPLDTGNKWQLSATAYRNGSLWTARSTAMNFVSGAVSAIRWYQVDANFWPVSVNVVQDSTLGAEGTWHFYPAIMVDALNNVAITFARSSSTEFASVYYTGRLASDPPNTLRPAVLLKGGTANLNMVLGGVNRYGDYFGIALDPSDGSFWLHGEYAKASNQWGTWVGNVVAARIPFAGTPGETNCHGTSVSALAHQFGGMDAAAAALGFPSVQALQDAITAFCGN